LSAVGVSCRDDFDVRTSNSSRRGALGTLISEFPLASATKEARTTRIQLRRCAVMLLSLQEVDTV
jgi:hypothetical protein